MVTAAISTDTSLTAPTMAASCWEGCRARHWAERPVLCPAPTLIHFRVLRPKSRVTVLFCLEPSQVPSPRYFLCTQPFTGRGAFPSTGIYTMSTASPSGHSPWLGSDGGPESSSSSNLIAGRTWGWNWALGDLTGPTWDLSLESWSQESHILLNYFPSLICIF